MLVSNHSIIGQDAYKISKHDALSDILSSIPKLGSKDTKFKVVSLGNHANNYARLGFVSCFNNILQSKLKCPKCPYKSKTYKTTKALCFHLTGEVHENDSQLFPTITHCIKLVEMYSLILQFHMLRGKT